MPAISRWSEGDRDDDRALGLIPLAPVVTPQSSLVVRRLSARMRVGKPSVGLGPHIPNPVFIHAAPELAGRIMHYRAREAFEPCMPTAE